MTLKWKDMSFRVWVEENQDVWVPDCLDHEVNDSPVTDSPVMSSPVLGSYCSEKKVGEEAQDLDGLENFKESPVNDAVYPEVDVPMHERENMHVENPLSVGNYEAAVGPHRLKVHARSDKSGVGPSGANFGVGPFFLG
ncbi:hypothetical protein Hanom_Chr06g00552921 [Helianthus anomalus]